MSARVAQSVEQRPEKPRVGGSIPSPRTIQFYLSLPVRPLRLRIG